MGKLDYVDLLITREDLDEEGLSYMNFGGMPLTDRVCDSGAGRYQLVSAGTFLVCGGGFDRTSLFPDFVAKRIEVGFLLISLTFGTIFSLSPRQNKVSWDEEVHFCAGVPDGKLPDAGAGGSGAFTGVYGGRRYLAVQSAGKPGRAGGAHFVSESNAGYRHGEHL